MYSHHHSSSSISIEYVGVVKESRVYAFCSEKRLRQHNMESSMRQQHTMNLWNKNRRVNSNHACRNVNSRTHSVQSNICMHTAVVRQKIPKILSLTPFRFIRTRIVYSEKKRQHVCIQINLVASWKIFSSSQRLRQSRWENGFQLYSFLQLFSFLTVCSQKTIEIIKLELAEIFNLISLTGQT